MATAVKPVGVGAGKVGKDILEKRKSIEALYRGKGGSPVPPERLTESQLTIWNMIVGTYEEAGILAGLDSLVLEPFVVAIDSVNKIDQMINENPELLDSQLPNRRKIYMADVWRGCQEFCISPQARAKIGSLAAAAAKEKSEADPLMEALK